MGFVLSLVDKEIPYIPTAKQAVIGKISPFAKPLLVQIVVFVFTLAWISYDRFNLLTEVELIASYEITYGMLAFAFIPFLLACASMYAVWESSKLTSESPWEEVDLNQIKTELSQKSGT